MTRNTICLSKVLQLFQNGLAIIDEVDWVLDPLRSELNFPIGAKQPLDLKPRRWELPMHILEAIFDANALVQGKEHISQPVGPTHRTSFLEKLRDVLTEGYAGGSQDLQSEPHCILLNERFYHEKMKTILLHWSLLFFRETEDLDTELSEVFGEQWYNAGGAIEYYLLCSRKDLASGRLGIVGETNTTKVKEDFEKLPKAVRQLLNLLHDWLAVFVPFLLKKINRVTFGLMNRQDYERAIRLEPQMPQTRNKLAIPFVGKDMPSNASEFAHPDITIGLTILAYRYSGLREQDMADIIATLQERAGRELGPICDRPSVQLFEKWTKEAVEVKRSSAQAVPMANAVPRIDKIQRSDGDDLNKVWTLLRHSRSMERWYLLTLIFEKHSQYQTTKLTASSADLGGTMLFKRRIGFSGTPSDLLPSELGKPTVTNKKGGCAYEEGTDGAILNTLNDPDIVSFKCIGCWNPRMLLTKIVEAGKYNALIDTGALITGLTNVQVAEFLLTSDDNAQWDGVVYLDSNSTKMVLVKETMNSVKIEDSGIPWDRRFAFYDQVHTTGVDINHKMNAVAVLTLGKDMNLRDYAQGAYRMRGIAKGQTLELFIIPEIQRLVYRELNSQRRAVDSVQAKSRTQMLYDVTAWLVVNLVRAERLQYSMLQIQDASNVWRRNAFRQLMAHQHKVGDPAVKAAVEVFEEPIDTRVRDEIPSASSVAEAIANRREQHGSFIMWEADEEFLTELQKQNQQSSNSEQGAGLQAEQQQEQEQEQEQEIEIEKFADLAYSRDMEEPVSWEFDKLKYHPVREREGAMWPKDDIFYFAGHTLDGQNPPNSVFKVNSGTKLKLPSELMLSRNFFNTQWAGSRRLKNLEMVLEWVPNSTLLAVRNTREEELVEFAQKATAMIMHSFAPTGKLKGKDIAYILASAFNDQAAVDDVLRKTAGGVDGNELLDFLLAPRIRQREDGRYFVAVSMIEAETIRRILHLRTETIANSTAAMALRCLSRGFCVMDRSSGYIAGPSYQEQLLEVALKFIDDRTYYSPLEITHLLRCVQLNTKLERRMFFGELL